MRTNRRPIAIMRRSCSDSLLTASQLGGVFGSDNLKDVPSLGPRIPPTQIAVAETARFQNGEGTCPQLFEIFGILVIVWIVCTVWIDPVLSSIGTVGRIDPPSRTP